MTLLLVVSTGSRTTQTALFQRVMVFSLVLTVRWGYPPRKAGERQEWDSNPRRTGVTRSSTA